MSESTIQFLPFHAINEFMRPDFRLAVVRYALTNQAQLPARFRDPINRLIRKTVSVPGFRNSEKAPVMVKVLPAAKAFEKNAELVAAIIAAWAELHAELKEQIYQVLKDRGWHFFPEEMSSPADLPSLKSEADWGVLPLNADRMKLPGFLTYWPPDQNFESIYDTYTALYPHATASLDEVSLMVVWLALRLPYHIVEDETDEVEPSSDAHPRHE